MYIIVYNICVSKQSPLLNTENQNIADFEGMCKAWAKATEVPLASLVEAVLNSPYACPSASELAFGDAN